MDRESTLSTQREIMDQIKIVLRRSLDQLLGTLSYSDIINILMG